MSAATVKGPKKTYGKVEAVKGVDFEVRPGEVFGGAGKTHDQHALHGGQPRATAPASPATTWSGSAIRWGATSGWSSRTDARRLLTAEQNLRFHAELYGSLKQSVGDRIRQVMEMVALRDHKDAKAMTFSAA